MRDFTFITKQEPTKKAVLRVDIIDDEFEKFTIMYMEGVRNTIFEKYIPWKLGAVITEDDIQEWLFEFQPIFNGVKYGGEEVVTLGVAEHVLTLNPTITNGDATKIKLICVNKFDDKFEKEIDLEDGETSEAVIVEGFEYSFELMQGGSWTTTEPEAFTCDGDEAVSLAITVPIVLDVQTITITPDLTGGVSTTATMTGTKTDYSTTTKEITLENGVPVVEDIYKGYSYSFTPAGTCTWTSGSAPAVIVCDDDEVVTLGITIGE